MKQGILLVVGALVFAGLAYKALEWRTDNQLLHSAHKVSDSFARATTAFLQSSRDNAIEQQHEAEVASRRYIESLESANTKWSRDQAQRMIGRTSMLYARLGALYTLKGEHELASGYMDDAMTAKGWTSGQDRLLSTTISSRLKAEQKAKLNMSDELTSSAQ